MAQKTPYQPPEDLAKDVHQALKAWHAYHAPTRLDAFLYIHRIRELRDFESPHLIVNQYLMDGLNRLKEINPSAAKLLEHRFWDQQTAQEVAFRINTSENAVYQRQRTAIEALARVLWDMETAARDEQADRIALRLPPPTYTRLFGVDDKLAQLRQRVASPSGPWLLALEGMGGIGKTTLADALAREIARDIRFKEVAWLSARQQLFRMPGVIESLAPAANLTLDDLLDQLIDQLNLSGLARQSDREKRLGVRGYLKRRPSLVIVDNLETLEDFRAIVPHLRELSNPSKFLITTRYSLRGESGVYLLPLEGLSQEASLAFIRYEAAMQGLADLAEAAGEALAPLVEITGGNPLAIKLLIGQSHTFPLVALLDRMRGMRGEAAQELLAYIHADAWRQLDHESRRVMRTMLLVPDAGGAIEQIAAAAALELDAVLTLLQRLVSHALVQVKDVAGQRYYTMHRLTQQFVAGQTGDGGAKDVSR